MSPFRALLIILAVVGGISAYKTLTTTRAPIDAVGECNSNSDLEKKQECLEEKTKDLRTPSAEKSS